MMNEECDDSCLNAKIVRVRESIYLKRGSRDE